MGDKRGQKLLDTVDWNSIEWSIEHSTEAERAYKKVPNPSSIVIQQISNLKLYDLDKATHSHSG